MKKIITIIAILTLSIFSLCACSLFSTPAEEKNNVIPEQNIKYSHYEIGNVIDEGKQAVFINFTSDYNVKKIEVSGNLLDKNNNVLYSFETTLNFDTPTKKPDPFVLVNKDIVLNILSVSITKVKAYTAEDINSND